MNIVGFVSLSPIHYGSCYSEFHQTSSRDAKTCLMLQPEPSCASRDNYPSHQPSPRETMDQNTDILLTPIFWFTLIKETKVKDHVKWRIPLGSQWAVSACLPPPTPRTSMIRLWSRGSPRSGADSWLRVVPGWHLVSHCPLVYYLPRIWELVFFVQQRLNAAGFLSRETPSWWI